MKAVLIRISTQLVIKKGEYPRIKIEEPIQGLDTDLEWYLFEQLDKPIFNPFLEKLEDFENTTERFHLDFPELRIYEKGYNIVPLTQTEVEAYAQRQEDLDSASAKMNKYKWEGVQAFDRLFAFIIREKENGNLTAVQAKNLAIGLYAPLEPLYKGLWQLVKINLSNETPPTNAALLAIFNKVVLKVDNYINDNY